MTADSLVIHVEDLHHHHGHSNRIEELHHHDHHHHDHHHHHHGRSSRVQPVPTTPPDHGNEDAWDYLEEENKEKTSAHTLSESLGLEDFSSTKVWRSSIAELFGTATLVFMTDTIIIAAYENGTSSPKLIMGAMFPVIVAFLVLATIPVSGGHINPIVSMAFGLMGKIPLSRALIYIIAQCTGGILGSLALKAVLDGNTERSYSLGGCTNVIVVSGPDGGSITTGIETGRAFYLEAVCSFAFLLISRWIGFDAKNADITSRLTYCFAIGIGVGFNFFVSSTITGVKGYSGAGVNPATCFGPAVVRGGYLWHGHWIYWLGPGLASMGFYLYTRIAPVDNYYPEENKHDFFNVLKACRRAIHHKVLQVKDLIIAQTNNSKGEQINIPKGKGRVDLNIEIDEEKEMHNNCSPRVTLRHKAWIHQGHVAASEAKVLRFLPPSSGEEGGSMGVVPPIHAHMP